MTRKLLLTILIMAAVIMIGCSNKQTNSQPTVNTSTELQQTKDDSNTVISNSSTTADRNTKDKSNTANTASNENSMYNVNQSVYKIANISIIYPQISNLGDDNKQSKINKLIKDSVIEGYDLTETIKTGVMQNYNEPIENLNMDVTYTIELQNKNILSIKYLSEAFMKGGAHPYNYIYTTNIDIGSMKILKLSDIVTIDQTLVNAFRNGIYIPWSKDFDISDNKTVIENFKKEIYNYDNDKEMIASLKQSDNKERTANPYAYFSYLTKDGLVISTEISHAGGDHVEFKIPYSNIIGNIRTDDDALNNLLGAS